MIPQAYRFVIVNKTGKTLTWTNNGRLLITVIGWFVDPATGKVTYASVSEDVPSLSFDGSGDVILDTDEVIFPENFNTGNLHLGLMVSFQVTHDEGTLADGTLDLYLSGGQSAASLPTDASNYSDAETDKLQFVGSLTWAPGADDNIARSNVFNL